MSTLYYEHYTEHSMLCNNSRDGTKRILQGTVKKMGGAQLLEPLSEHCSDEEAVLGAGDVIGARAVPTISVSDPLPSSGAGTCAHAFLRNSVKSSCLVFLPCFPALFSLHFQLTLPAVFVTAKQHCFLAARWAYSTCSSGISLWIQLPRWAHNILFLLRAELEQTRVQTLIQTRERTRAGASTGTSAGSAVATGPASAAGVRVGANVGCGVGTGVGANVASGTVLAATGSVTGAAAAAVGSVAAGAAAGAAAGSFMGSGTAVTDSVFASAGVSAEGPRVSPTICAPISW